MSWKKYFTSVPNNQPMAAVPNPTTNSSGTSSNFSSFLPEVYAGHPNRIQRYYQYDDMDRDSDISAALDTIADFSTQSEEQSEQPLDIKYTDDATETEVMLLKRHLEKWLTLNNFRSQLWYMFRDTIKNGDAFFLRDPETHEWLWLDHYTVEMVKVEEDGAKKPSEYLIRGFDYNREGKFAATRADMSQYKSPFGAANTNGRPMAGGSGMGSTMTLAGGARDPRTMRAINGNNDLFVVDADHVIHLSLSVGNDINWPFGQSVLESIFKTFKQKELLEDAIIIYRVQRAPERRVFYIDVGQMPPAKARAHLDQIKNEIHQRRIPNHSGGGTSMLDSAYNPLSIMEDFFFAQSAEGRGSKVETLPGGESLGEITDLTFFTKKMQRGLRIPESYMSLGGEDSGGGASYNDGKLGAAMIQEYRFNKYCMRLQSLLSPVFDAEFKRYLRESGVEIDQSIFHMMFCPPQNFTKYRQIEIDQAQAGVYQMVADNKKLSERFKLKRFLNLTEEEIIENEKLWSEENAAKIKRASGASPAETEIDADLSSVGLRPGGDMMGMDDMSMDGEDMGDPMGDPASGPEGGVPPAAPEAPPA